jgi:hypothetical protein
VKRGATPDERCGGRGARERLEALESRRRTERSVDGATWPEAAEEGRTRAQRAAGRDDAPAPPAARATSIRSADREQLQEPLQPARA